MSDKQKLQDMLDNLVNGKPEMAQIAFHDYLRSKVHGVVGGEAEQEADLVPNTDTTTKE